ncbi:PD40 domain-containing protein [Kibdelosporangium lantanae]
MRKLVLALAVTAVLVGAAVIYAVSARSAATVPAERLTLAPGQLLFRGTDTGRVTALGSDGSRRVSGLRCDRFAVAQQTAVCLAVQPDTLPAVTDVLVLDGNLTVVHRESLPGTPSRARVSPDGKLVYWTLFVTGDSYAATGFSTRAGIYDVSSGRLVKTVEELAVFVDGRRYFASDVNYWGLTFAADGNRFYATLGSRGKTYLVAGDLRRYQGKVLRENVECPSLSPDGTRVAFKKKVGDGAWRLSVLELASLRETELAEVESVDDQALWRDDSTVLYGRDNGIWSVPADGGGRPVLLARDAASPAVTG